MFYRSLFSRHLVAVLERLLREIQQASGYSLSICGSGGFPALHVGGTPQSVEFYAFVPGVDPASIYVQLEKGVLTVAGERPPAPRRHTAAPNLHPARRSGP